MTLDISPEDALRELARRTNAYDPTQPPKWASPAQRRIILSDSLKVVGLAGWQAGKTIGGARALKRQMYRRGPGDYIACAPTFKLLDKKVLPELKAILKGLAVYRVSDGLFEFTEEGKARWGAHEEFRLFTGYAENPDSLESATYKAAYGDEVGAKAFPEASHHCLVSRLLVHRGPLIYTSRPYQSGWFEKYTASEDVDLVQFPSWENPALQGLDWAALEETMPDWQFSMRYRGVFTKPLASIYDCFDPKRHVVPDFKIPAHWSVYTGEDFGPVNRASVYVAVKPDGEVFKHKDHVSPRHECGYVFDSYHASGQHAKVHADAIKARAGRPIRRSWGGAPSEKALRSDYAKAGHPIDRPSTASVEAGIGRVYRQIATDGLFFFQFSAQKVYEEIEDYSRELDKDGDPEQDIEDKSKYHRADCVRYVVSSLWPEPLPGEKEPYKPRLVAV